MSSPFMQLYVADYLGDTQHLSTEQHGAYLLILFSMWRAIDGKLPDDDGKLSRIARLSIVRWRKIKADIMDLLVIENGSVTQKRLQIELKKAQEKSQKRAEAGRNGGLAKTLKSNKTAQANASVLLKHSSEPEPESESKKEESISAEPQAAHAPEALGLPVISLPTNVEGEEVGIFPAQVDEYAKLYPNVDVHQELRAMRGWLLGNERQRKTRRGMPRFVNSWLSRAQDKPNGQGNRGQIDRQARPRTSGSATFFDACVDSIRNDIAADSEREPDQAPPRGTITVLPPPRDDRERSSFETGAVRGRLAASEGF